MEIGDRIQNLLDEKNMTQRELADALYLNANTINGYIKNRRYPDIETAARIARFFGISVDYLMGFSNIRHYPDEPITKKEGELLNNYRALDAYQKKVLEHISDSLCDLTLSPDEPG